MLLIGAEGPPYLCTGMQASFQYCHACYSCVSHACAPHDVKPAMMQRSCEDEVTAYRMTDAFSASHETAQQHASRPVAYQQVPEPHAMGKVPCQLDGQS